MKISLSGHAGCGKSTIAKALEKDYGFRIFSFASKLKELCNDLFPEKMHGNKNEYRGLLQKVGTDLLRTVDQDVWVKYLVRQIRNNGKPNKVVDDTRFLNELMTLKREGFKLVRVERDKELLREAGYNVDDKHISETQLDLVPFEWWDLIIYNNFEYPFEEAVEILVKHFGVKK